MRRQTFLFTVISAVFATSTLFAAEKRDEIRLWPNTAPGEKEKLPSEEDITKPNEGLVAGKRVIRLGNVSDPTLTYYPAPAANDSGCAVLVCPGGAYHILAMDLEGTEVCEWLNSIGVTGVLLKYRVPARKNQPRHLAPLQDAQRALRLIRSGTDAGKIKHLGILGFSAGGHLAAATSNSSEKRAYEAIDDSDRQSCRPDFTVLIYPAYLTEQVEPTKLMPEVTVTSNTPPTFLIQTQDDGVGVWNAMGYGLALERAKVPFEMHIYPKGGHGYGLRPTNRPVTLWPKEVELWMKQIGVLGGK
jgi:acetyl esterase/lipase